MLSLLGLCARAGRLVTGEKACVQKIRSGGACLALLDGAAADNAVSAVMRACAAHGVPLVRTGEYELGDAVGKPSRMAAVVTDPGFAGRIIELSNQKGNTRP